MKRSPLKRRTPLRAGSRTWGREVRLLRKTRLNPKRATPRRDGQVRDRAYLDAVIRLGTCCAAKLPNAGRCWGPTDPHHPYRVGANVKCGDDEVVDICRGHHGAIEAAVDSAASGPFRGWSRELRVTWCAVQAEHTRARVKADRATRASAPVGGIPW